MTDTNWWDTIQLADTHGLPKYRQLEESVVARMREGGFAAHEKLPPVRDLAWRLGVTPGTVQRAYRALTEAGHAKATVGRGTFLVGGGPVEEAPRPSPFRIPLEWDHPETDAEDGPISLYAPRLPDVGQVAAVRRALSQVGSASPSALLDYPTRAGFRRARQAVADWFGDDLLGPVDEADIVLTHGGQNAVLLVLLTLLSGPKPVVIVEEVAYAGFRRAAELLRAQVVGVPMDEDGVIPEALDEVARATGAIAFCTMPEAHNPTAILTPLKRRRKIAAIAAARGLQILEDGCFRTVENAAPSYRQLAPERTWHINSLSKVLTPALRTGFAIAPPGQGDRLKRAAEFSYFGLARPLGEAVESLLSDPTSKALSARIQARMEDYLSVAVRGLAGFQFNTQPHVPYVWLTLPEGWRVTGFCTALEREGVLVRPGDEFAIDPARAPSAIRVSVNAQVPLEEFASAILRMRRLLQRPPEALTI
ncbi:MAG: PLP-dependent aminotransferase family protein [Pseudomonadota bacterium]